MHGQELFCMHVSMHELMHELIHGIVAAGHWGCLSTSGLKSFVVVICTDYVSTATQANRTCEARPPRHLLLLEAPRDIRDDVDLKI